MTLLCGFTFGSFAITAATLGASLALMYERTTRTGYNAVSAVWNAAYDAGMGAGAIGMGLVTGHLGYPGTFLLTAALILPALVLARWERGR